MLMDPQPPPIFVIPGMRVGCMPYNAMISGTLECFYDQACLNTTAKLISTLAPSEWPAALNISMTRFTNDSSISLILEEQFIEEWRRSANFIDYFTSCAPYECAYTILKRNNYIYLITLLLGLFGGLNVVVYFIAPILVRFGHMAYKTLTRKYQPMSQSQPRKSGITERFR